MWSEDPGKIAKAEPQKLDANASAKTTERAPEQVSGGMLRWFFSFDGWRLVEEEDEFVLA